MIYDYIIYEVHFYLVCFYELTIKIYNISNIILQYKINNITFYFKYQSKSYNLLELEENIISEYIFDINSKGFLFKFKNIKDIVNYILKSKGAKRVGKF